MIHVIQQSYLEKIQVDSKEFASEYTRTSALSNEELAYQIVLYSDNPAGERAKVELRGGGYHKMSEVKQVPVTWPHRCDGTAGDYLKDKPTLMPDMLVAIDQYPTFNLTDHPTVLWVDVIFTSPGEHSIDLYVNGEFRSSFTVEILPYYLEKSRFNLCEYIDPCSIAKYHGVSLFSSEHWSLLGKYFKIAAKHGVNRVLTPLYRPVYDDLPLGGEDIQLFTVTKKNNDYYFNFDLLDSWIVIARKNNIEQFMFPPLIPSIKTLECPKILMKQDYCERYVFDEEDNVLSREFTYFIQKFLRELIHHLKEIKVFNDVSIQFTHAPSVGDEKNYVECQKIWERIPWCNQISDTMTPTDFYELSVGYVPFFSSAKLSEFIDYNVSRYLYHDVKETNSVVNTLIAAPTMAIRRLAPLAFRHGIVAFFSLWFNNYCSENGEKTNVLIDTSNDNYMPSGSCFLVYPDLKGPVPSVRLKQLFYALQDIRILEKLNTSIPFERIYSRIDKKYKFSLDGPMISNKRYLEFREEIYSLFDK